MSSQQTQVFEALIEARKRGASDLHLAANEVVVMRVDGAIVPLNGERASAEALREFVRQNLDEPTRKRLAEVGSCDGAIEDQAFGPVRVHVYNSLSGISIALRLLAEHIADFASLGLPSVVAQFGELMSGLVLCVGPTGSGKTTTLASLLERINETAPKRIITIEDPIEYRFKPRRSSVTQIEVGPTGHAPTFAEALRGVLRSDPDVLLVGEARDTATMAACLEVAEQGRLCFSTVHARDASSVFDRIIGAFPVDAQPQIRVQLAATVAGVVVLRLLPRRDGQGRVAAAEVMVGTDAIRGLIREGKTQQLRNAIENGRLQYGMQTLEQHLVELANERVITWETARAAAVRPEQVVPVGSQPASGPPVKTVQPMFGTR